MSGDWPIGRRIAGAAALAVERVNADANLLPGRELRYSKLRVHLSKYSDRELLQCGLVAGTAGRTLGAALGRH